MNCHTAATGHSPVAAFLCGGMKLYNGSIILLAVRTNVVNGPRRQLDITSRFDNGMHFRILLHRVKLR